MEQWAEIRRRVLVEGVGKRQILRETGMHWRTLEKILTHSVPPGYQLGSPRGKPKLGPHLAWIERVLESDQSVPAKQRHTAKRIFERLRAEEGYTGSYTAVKDAVRGLREQGREVFVPLVHRPGEAQVDFGHALAKVRGVLRKVVFFAMALPYSDALFVAAFERECRENVLLMGNSGTGKTHLATALGFSACQQGRAVRFFTVSGLVTQLLERREERSLERLQQQLERLDLLILDELGYVPFSKAGAELLFEVVSRAYERTSLLVTTNLPFEKWIEVLGNERLTGALLDRLTHRVHILEANGESYRLRESKRRLKKTPRAEPEGCANDAP